MDRDFARRIDAVLAQFSPRRGIDRVADLLIAGCRRRYVKSVRNSFFVDQIFENEFCHGGTADVAVADE